MIGKSTRLLLLLLGISMVRAQVSQVWVSDQGDGRYTNPVLYADYSDPDVVRVGGDYYMTASSFTAVPGLPILHSRDLVNWSLIGHALEEILPKTVFDRPRHGQGVWAPSIRHHKGEYYIFWGDPDFGIYRVRAKDPRGPWEVPVLVKEGKGLIDPCPLWDEDGKAYLVHAYAGSRAGVKSLLVLNRMDPEGTRVLDRGRVIFDGHDGHPTVEGPKFHKRNGHYYIFAPAGGVATGWQLVLRSKEIYGPYQERIVLEQGSTATNGPHQGAWVEGPGGGDWFLHFQDAGAYGRILHLQPMGWTGDWPWMGRDLDGNGIGEPVPSHVKPLGGGEIATPPESDEFDSHALGLQWQWQANPETTWYSLIPGRGFLRLFSLNMAEGENNLWNRPNLLLQKFPAPGFRASAKIKLVPEGAAMGKSAGLLVFGLDYATLTLTQRGNEFVLRQTLAVEAGDNLGEELIEEVKLKGNEAVLQVVVRGPDALCQFRYSTDGEVFKDIGKPFKAREGQWVGAKVGLFSASRPGIKYGGYADVDYFRITK